MPVPGATAACSAAPSAASGANGSRANAPATASKAISPARLSTRGAALPSYRGTGRMCESSQRRTWPSRMPVRGETTSRGREARSKATSPTVAPAPSSAAAATPGAVPGTAHQSSTAPGSRASMPAATIHPAPCPRPA